MSFLDYAKKILNYTETENGDIAFESTGNACLDYFYAAGAKRGDKRGALQLFIRAYLESPATALKLLLYTRNIKGGLGERDLFRYCLNCLGQYEPNDALKIVPYIVEYGRYDDLLCLLYTPVEDAVLKIIRKQLDEDLANKKAGKPISLLAKWLPSINTNNWSARKTARYLAYKLDMTYAEYRKMLSFLRKGLILENNLREKDYTFDYQSVPSAAMNNYREAFLRNDEERFKQYLIDISAGKAKMNIAVLDIVNFIKRAGREMTDLEMRDYYETAWKQLVDESSFNSKTLVVRDGSGSMYMCPVDDYHTYPIDIANAITLLAASRLKGEFADQFITFSADPEIVDLRKKKSLMDKLLYLRTFDDISNTNIEKVYQLVIDVYKRPDFKKEDAVDQIIIVSDMEFDCLEGRVIAGDERSTFEYFKDEFSKLGYKMPEVVFWNVDSRNGHAPVEENEQGVKLVSGATKNILGLVMTTESMDPTDFMNKVLEQYAFIDKLFE